MSKVKSKKEILWKRFYNYIYMSWQKNPERTIPRNSLFSLALNKGYTKTEIWNAIERLEKELQIARANTKEIDYYYVNFTHTEIKRLKADIKWFNSL